MYFEQKLRAFIKVISILVFFLTFFTNYFLYSATLFQAFVKGVISLITASLILHFLYFFWRFAFSEQEWKIIADPSLRVSSEDEPESKRAEASNLELAENNA